MLRCGSVPEGSGSGCPPPTVCTRASVCVCVDVGGGTTTLLSRNRLGNTLASKQLLRTPPWVVRGLFPFLLLVSVNYF